MADLACPSCGKTVKGKAGLLVHVSCWCCKNQSNLTSLLQQHHEHVQTVAEEKRRRLCLEYNGPDLGLPAHNHCPSWCYCDNPPALSIPVLTSIVAEELELLPEEGAPMDNIDINLDLDPISTSQQSSAQGTPTFVCTHSDGNDLFQQYQDTFLSYNPENITQLDHLCDGLIFQCPEPTDTQLSNLCGSYFAPFLSTTVWHLMEWFYNGSTQKSLEDLNSLINNFNAQWETCQLDNAPCDSSSPLFASDGWHTTLIPI
ncbi:hypothetical protein V8B97DRAFT_2027200 [Scleroderma yunnanense]